MRLFKKYTLIFSLIVFIIAQSFFILPLQNKVEAADYTISYAITYSIGQDGQTNVDYSIRLTNLNDTLYAASESLIITQTDVYNVSANNSLGMQQAVSTSQEQGGTKITTTFSNPAIGQGSFDSWDIHYSTKQIAVNTGHAWNIFVPGFGDKTGSNINSIQIAVNVPKTFGEINYASPRPAQVTSTSDTNSYSFSNSDINSSGINLIFGKSETYSFNFNYPIKNTGSGVEQFTITVPPDTATQQVSFTSLSPKPNSFTINNDGNYILNYLLGGKNTGTIHVSGIANVQSTYNLLSNKRSTPTPLSAPDQSAYTAPMKYWESDNSQIKNLAISLTKNDTTNIDKAKSIYDYIVKTFKYSNSALYDNNRQRKGALYAINHPTDVICQEYVDAYIALLRSINVPAVFDAGFGNTLSPYNTLPPNVLHAWAEFYDPSYGWIPVDPTWGSTSGADFFGNIGSTHFLLAKYGHDSSNPILVLAFVASKNPEENMKLSPTDSPFIDTTSQSIDGSNNISGISGIPNNIAIPIKNTGNRVIILSKSVLDISGHSYESDPSASASYIFPQMTGNVMFPVLFGNLFDKQDIDSSLALAYSSFNEHTITDKTQLNISFKPIGLAGAIPFLAVILIFVISYILVNLFIKLRGRFAKT